MSQNVLSCWLLDEIHRAFLPTMVKIHSFVKQTADVREPRCSRFRPFIITVFFLLFFNHSRLVPTNRDETAWLLPLSLLVRLCFSLSKVYVFRAPYPDVQYSSRFALLFFSKLLFFNLVFKLSPCSKCNLFLFG